MTFVREHFFKDHQTRNMAETFPEQENHISVVMLCITIEQYECVTWVCCLDPDTEKNGVC